MLVGDEAAPRAASLLSQVHLTADDVQLVEVGEFAHRPALEPPTGADDGAVGRGEQVGLGGNEHRVGFARIPVDDLILQLAARRRSLLPLHEHLQILAVRIDCRQSGSNVDGAEVVNRTAQAAEQPFSRRPFAPLDEELVVGCAAHDQVHRRAALREIAHHRDPQAFEGRQHCEIAAVGRDSP
jgi:hypothetical protein